MPNKRDATMFLFESAACFVLIGRGLTSVKIVLSSRALTISSVSVWKDMQHDAYYRSKVALSQPHT